MKSYKLNLTILLVFFASIALTQNLNPKTLVDHEGNTYKTVMIDGKLWMAENYRAVTDANGNEVEGIFNCDNDEKNTAVYGKLYRWTAAMRACPKGWRLPTRDEWVSLIESNGGIEKAGAKLKSTELWEAPNTGANNESGFTGIPAGFEYDGKFLDKGKHGDYWGMLNEDHSFSICLYHDMTYAKLMEDNDKEVPIAFSVRYVKDSE